MARPSIRHTADPSDERAPNAHAFLQEELTDAGFDVILAPSGKAALAQLESDPARFRAIVTDIRIGDGPSGWDIASKARERVPGMPVVYISADSAADWATQGVAGSVMIQKPFVMAQILEAIASLVGTGRL